MAASAGGGLVDSFTGKWIGELHGRDNAEDGGDIQLSGRDRFEADAARNRQGAFGDGDQEEDCEADGGGCGNLRSQIATSKRGGARYKPYAFTGCGIMMLTNMI